MKTDYIRQFQPN